MERLKRLLPSQHGTDWDVIQEAIYWREESEEDYAIARHIEIPGQRVNLRSDNRQPLGIVTDKYKVIQNSEGFRFLDSLIEEREMEYESAFSLRGGRQVVLLARLPIVDTIVAEDTIQRYVILSLSHDGTSGVNFGPVATRVVCANTYAMAEREGTMKGLSIRHQGKIEDKLEQARAIIGLVNHQFDEYRKTGRLLAASPFDQETWIEYLDLLCPRIDPRDPDWSDRRERNIEDTRRAIEQTYRNERQQTAPDTAWAAFNAVVEHIDHLPRRGQTRRQKAEARFNVCLYGPGRDMKKRAYELACRFAGLAE